MPRKQLQHGCNQRAEQRFCLCAQCQTYVTHLDCLLSCHPTKSAVASEHIVFRIVKLVYVDVVLKVIVYWHTESVWICTKIRHKSKWKAEIFRSISMHNNSNVRDECLGLYSVVRSISRAQRMVERMCVVCCCHVHFTEAFKRKMQFSITYMYIVVGYCFVRQCLFYVSLFWFYVLPAGQIVLERILSVYCVHIATHKLSLQCNTI